MFLLGGVRGQTATPSHPSKDFLVDIFAIPAVAAVLGLAYAGLQALTLLVEPFAGEASAALAVVMLTVIVRLALIPVGISQVKAEWTRRRLAPKLAALQRKYTKKPELLQRKTLELYRDENASPLAGLLPVLAQAPVLGVVYTLFIRATINGHANALLAHQLFGAPLGMSLLQAISTGTWAGLAAFAAVLLIMAVVAYLSRRTTLLYATGPVTGAIRAMSWAPFLSLVFAAFVPLAAALYLATSTVWTLGERAVLRRRYWGELPTATA
jgi:YidC/Oxa1 family membrane protein insertase